MSSIDTGSARSSAASSSCRFAMFACPDASRLHLIEPNRELGRDCLRSRATPFLLPATLGGSFAKLLKQPG